MRPRWCRRASWYTHGLLRAAAAAACCALRQQPRVTAELTHACVVSGARRATGRQAAEHADHADGRPRAALRGDRRVVASSALRDLLRG